jgi:hypothetical protein
MNIIVPLLVIALVLCWLDVRLYNDWLFLRWPRLNALGTIIGGLVVRRAESRSSP